jgi:hypothetical protein
MKRILKSTMWLALAGIAFAQGNLRPQLTLEGFLVISEIKNGVTTERFEKASNAKPGSILEYRTTASNPNDKAVSKLVMDLPVPKNTFYLEGTATNNASIAKLMASADNKRSFSTLPLKRKVVKDGKTIEEIVPANQYTHLRWVVNAPLAAKSSVTFKARVKIR